MTGLGPVLARLGLAQYTAAFLEEGFDTWETVLDITESDLDALNVKLGHRRRLQREIANTRGIAIGQLVPSPTLLTSIEGIRFEGLEEASSKSSSKQDKFSGGSGKRKYRRHPKPDENAPERPPSAYVIFSNKIREELKPQNLSFTDIAKRVGERWQILNPEEKEPYESRAGSLKEKYSAELTKYKRTHEYRDYTEYFAEFKARNTAGPSETKRPKLEAQHSTESSASGDSRHESRYGNTTPVVGLHRPRLDSFGSSQASPAGNMIAPLVLSGAQAATSVSLSPVPFSPYTDSSSGRGMGGTSRYSREGSPIGSEAAEFPQLPRISPLDDRGMTTRQTILPPIATDVSVPRVPSVASMHPRRSTHIPPSFLRNGTRSSISSSMSSNPSSGGTSTSSVFSGLSPVDDSRLKRALPPPASLAGPFGMVAEQTHSPGFHPAPLQSHQPSYNPSPSLSNDYSPVPSSGRSIGANDLIQNPNVFHEAGAAQPLRNRVTDRYGIYPDVPQERRSLMNLSLTGSPKDFRSNPRSRAFELRDAEYPSDRRVSPALGQMSPPSYDRPPSTSSQDQRGFGLRDDDSTDSAQTSRMDGLSVLALAGRMIDRDARKPP